jgi:hypothetical protein
MPTPEVKEPEVDRIHQERTEFYRKEQERRAKEEALPAPESPGRKADGSLTRAGMEAILRSGGSVIVAGRHYGKLEDLPSEAELTEGDAKASAAAGAALDAQIAALSRQKAALDETHARNVEAEKKKADEKHPPRR